VTCAPNVFEQSLLQVRLTSAGVTMTHVPCWASRVAAHMIRLVALHGEPALNESGFSAASIAPARAAFSTEILA